MPKVSWVVIEKGKSQMTNNNIRYPYKELAEIIDPHQRLANFIKQNDLQFENTLNAKLNEQLRALREGLFLPRFSEQQKRLLAPINLPNISLKLSEQFRLEQPNILGSISRQADTWRKLMQPSEDLVKSLNLLETQSCFIAWDSSLTQITKQFKESNLFRLKSDLAARLLEPFRVYTEFTERTVERLERSKSASVTKALKTSLYLAEEQLLSTTDTLSAILTVPEDNELASPPRSLILLNVQQDELLAALETYGSDDEAIIISHSPTINVAADAKLVLSLIVRCNKLQQAAQKPEIFKPTTRLLETFMDFQWLLPKDEQTFGNFIDCLYFIFYEGAGKDKLRFHIDNEGVLDDTDCDFIWCIKHLRNKWLRHDPDHGKETSIKNSWKELSGKLNWLGLPHFPVHEQHFRYLHSRLIKEACFFLQNIVDRLINNYS